ncbi:MAG: hypothetical protein ACUVTL_03755 [Thermoproteota archaeon]
MPILWYRKHVWMEIEEFDTNQGIMGRSAEYFEKIVLEYLASDKGRSGKVGAAQSYLFDSLIFPNLPYDSLREPSIRASRSEFCSNRYLSPP